MSGLRILPLVIATEVAKLRRTLALRMAIVSPLVVVGLYFLVGINGGGALVRPGGDPWLSFTRNTVQLWTLLMLPLFTPSRRLCWRASTHRIWIRWNRPAPRSGR